MAYLTKWLQILSSKPNAENDIIYRTIKRLYGLGKINIKTVLTRPDRKDCYSAASDPYQRQMKADPNISSKEKSRQKMWQMTKGKTQIVFIAYTLLISIITHIMTSFIHFTRPLFHIRIWEDRKSTTIFLFRYLFPDY